MGVIELQILIMITVVFSGILGGKKGAMISGVVWLVITLIMMYGDLFAAIQLVTVGISWQISLIIGTARDYYMKRRAIKLQSSMASNKD